ncbi:MAG TPA: recombination mediator RecR [Bacilli bacterium]
MKYPKALENLIESFQLYPGIGPKTAERLAFFTFLQLKDEDVVNFSTNLLQIKKELKYCSNCGVITDRDKCEICTDSSRERKLLVVEGTKDVVVFEKIGQYHGRYHVLNGLISPLNGIGPDDINIQNILKRVEDEKIEEIIIATSATIEGEMTALYIKNNLENKNIKVYRIGYGLPAGGDIEYADEITLIKALEGRKEM